MSDRGQTGARIGTTVTHRRYVPFSHAHYGGNLVDGAYGLGLFGDVATELCIRTDGDEGLFASYSDVQFKAALRGGDCVEVTAELVARGRPDLGESAAQVLPEPLVATTARGVVVVPAEGVQTDTPQA
jgi:3-aminobutyryl-CoA ammonia-lyase